MLLKDDVLFEFKNVRSFERVDLLCSLLDLCLPYELRFLGTCLEFLGKRDFYELREDERYANNVTHISQFRSLLDKNTRRKLVLYVSLLKSCNSECANCCNDTLTALCMNDVSQICRSEPKNAEKVLDELLLLYTIAVKHPAFNLHQKTEFAAHLSRLKEEDLRLAQLLYPNEDEASKSSRFCNPLDSIPDTPCLPKESSSTPVEGAECSSQDPVMPQANPLTCHMVSGSVYTNAVLPSPLNQASATCLNPAHVMVSSVCGHNSSMLAVPPPVNTHSPETVQNISTESGQPVIPLGLTPTPVSSSLVIGPGMVMPIAPPSSHCIMPSTGELGVHKGSLGHPNIVAPMMNVPPESFIHMPYSGPAPWLVPMPGHAPPVPLGCQTAPVSCSMTSTPTPPVPASTTTSSSGPNYTLCPPPSSSSTSSLMISCPKESSAKPEEGERHGSKPPTPPLAPQVNHAPHHAHQLAQPIPLPAPNQPLPMGNQTQELNQVPPNPYPTTQQPPPSIVQQPLKQNLTPSNPLYPNPISICTSTSHPPLAQPVPSKPFVPWYAAGDNLKEVIVREMPKYKSNLQDLSPDELLCMGDDQLKEIGLPQNAIQQLRTIMSKLHSTNGVNCLNRSDTVFHNENSIRRRHYHAGDGKGVLPLMQGPPPGTLHYGYIVPINYSGNNSTSNGEVLNKGNRQQHLHITNQVRALQLEEDSRRPCSNSSSTSDCSSGSHSPPETPSLPLISEVPTDSHCDRRYREKDEPWNSGLNDERNRDDRLHETERAVDERSRGPAYQPPGFQRNFAYSRSRGLSKAPPGIPTIPRGRGHPMVEKNRRDPASSVNGVPIEMNAPPCPYTISGPYSGPPVSSFLPHAPFQTMHAFHRFQPGTFLHSAGASFPFPQYHQHQLPHPTPPFISPIVAFSPAHPPPKLSCFNCGRQGHQGSDCKESTFEEITQQGHYHLDYKPYKEAGDCPDSDK